MISSFGNIFKFLTKKAFKKNYFRFSRWWKKLNTTTCLVSSRQQMILLLKRLTGKWLSSTILIKYVLKELYFYLFLLWLLYCFSLAFLWIEDDDYSYCLSNSCNRTRRWGYITCLILSYSFSSLKEDDDHSYCLSNFNQCLFWLKDEDT